MAVSEVNLYLLGQMDFGITLRNIVRVQYCGRALVVVTSVSVMPVLCRREVISPGVLTFITMHLNHLWKARSVCRSKYDRRQEINPTRVQQRLVRMHAVSTFNRTNQVSRSPAAFPDKQTTGMNHPIFTIESWSVYGLTIRTYNDCEGWHNRLNRKAGGMSLSYYRHVPALQSEAEAVAYELSHIRDGISRVRLAARTLEGRIRELWDKYAAGTIQTSALLEGYAAAYGPQYEE